MDNLILQIEQMVKPLKEEALIQLVHAYDHHIIECERNKTCPMNLLDYTQSDEYKELIDSGDIYDFMDYESDMEGASLEDLQSLAITFGERLIDERLNKGIQSFTKLDWLIYEFEIDRYKLTDEEEKRARQLDNDLMRYGYLPTDDGTLVQATPEELKDLNPTDFLWDDYAMVRQVLANHRDLVHVSTYQAQGDVVFVSQGWHFVNRLGYHLTSKPVLEENETVLV